MQLVCVGLQMVFFAVKCVYWTGCSLAHRGSSKVAAPLRQVHKYVSATTADIFIGNELVCIHHSSVVLSLLTSVQIHICEISDLVKYFLNLLPPPPPPPTPPPTHYYWEKNNNIQSVLFCSVALNIRSWSRLIMQSEVVLCWSGVLC